MSSSNGHTGSVRIFSNPSAREKDIVGTPSSFVDSVAREETMVTLLREMRNSVYGGVTNLLSPIQTYLSQVNTAVASAKNRADIEVLRHVPTTTHTVNTEKKLFVQKKLMPFYRAHRNNCHWAYPNYHSVNFFTASSVPSNAVWLYPNVVNSRYPSGCYSPTGSFTFEMFLNPRYTIDAVGNAYKAGTILHLSSSYALSLITGSSKDANGKPNGYRLLLQLSSSADVQPSTVTVGTGTGRLAFLSDDNSLVSNNWHHVMITWGTNLAEAGTGSFYVDGIRRGGFVYPSGSILPPIRNYALCVGNYYEGNNAGTNSTSRFFARTPTTREGLYELDTTSDVEVPGSFNFRHQLNAEFHDLSIREEYVIPSKANLVGSTFPKRAPVSLNNYMMYLPPFFIPGSPNLTVVNGDGGVLVTPFASTNGSSNHPFLANMSFGVAGRYNSLENFTRDFATGRHARLLNVTNSVILTTTNESITANEYLYASSSARLRNLMVLPCDDGNFRPNFEFLSNLEDRNDPRFVDDLGCQDLSLISLKNMVSGSFYDSLYHQTGSMFNDIVKTTPEAPKQVPNGLLAVYQRTRDASSNEVVFFDFSNLFYGERIKPGSFLIRDTNLTGSNSKIVVTLKDDYEGGLYRADSATNNAEWNHVGNIFYEEGIALIKSPALPFYGKNGFTIEFEGEKSIHTTKMNVMVDAFSYNTSSNSTWNTNMSASYDLNREADNQKHVNISGINFHDEDLNIVMRAKLAQPLVKRRGDRFLIKVKYDW